MTPHANPRLRGGVASAPPPPPQPLARDHALPAAEPALLGRLGLPNKQEQSFTKAYNDGAAQLDEELLLLLLTYQLQTPSARSH